MKELKDTVALMESDDYKDRFKAEYWQTKIRCSKLRKTLVKADAKTITLPNYAILKEQLAVMNNYLYLLEIRAETENIELE